MVLAHRRGSACFLKTPLASNVDPLKGAAKPGGFDALVTAAAAEEEDGNGQEGGDATGARKAAAALSALVLERGEAGPCTFLGVDGDFCALSSSVSLPSSSSAAGTKSSLAGFEASFKADKASWGAELEGSKYEVCARMVPSALCWCEHVCVRLHTCCYCYMCTCDLCVFLVI